MLKTGENIVTVEDCEDSEEEKQQQNITTVKQGKRQGRGSQSVDNKATTDPKLGSDEGAQPLKGQTNSKEQVASAPSILAEFPHIPWQYQEPQAAQPLPRSRAKSKTRWQQSQGKERQQGPRPGASNQWYTLSSRMHKHGTTIEMMYTGVTVPQPTQMLNIRAIPGVTHLTMELPAGVLPNMRSSTPDMPCLMNAMDFFRNPEEHVPDPSMGPPTTIYITPKSCLASDKSQSQQQQQQQSDCIEIVPLNSEKAAPIKRKCLNTGFQSYSLMQLEVDENESLQPGRLVLDADISPLYLLNTHQQLRLQSAIQQEGVSLTEALLPIVNDLYEEHERLHNAGFSILPAPMPLPYGTMQFHYNQQFGPLAEAFSLQTPEHDTDLATQPKTQRGQTRSQRKKVSASRWRSGSTVELSATIMALDQHGKYQPMVFSEWENMKKEQRQRQPSEETDSMEGFAGI